MDKEAIGALWISDLTPSINASITKITNKIYYNNAELTKHNYTNHTLNKLLDLSNGQPLLGYNFYIWNPEYREVLTDSLRLIANYVKNAEKVIAQIKLIKDYTVDGLKVIFIVGGQVIKQIPVKIAYNIATNVSLDIITEFFNAITPKIELGDMKYLNYINLVAEKLSLGINIDSSNRDYVYNKCIENREIAEIPLFYSLCNDSIDNNINSTKYISFNITLDLYLSGIKTEKYPTILTTYKKQNIYTYGKTYKLSKTSNELNENQLENLSHKYHNYNGHLCMVCGHYNNTHNYVKHYCSYCRNYTSIHHYNYKYEYINKTSHKAFCDCGNYIIEHHVKSNSNYSNVIYCYYCGGKMDLGIIQFRKTNELRNILNKDEAYKYTIFKQANKSKKCRDKL